MPPAMSRNCVILMPMQDNLQIPYGIFDFKRIRTEGYYYIDKTGYIPALEQSGAFLARDTTLHQIVYQFRGTELVRAEQIAEETMS